MPGPKPAARRGRPPAVTREQIAEAALEVGFLDLTFAAVRARLGVGESTIFRHVRDRDDLVRLALDLAIERTEWPALDGPWRDVLERMAIAAWHAWEAHPGSATEAARGIVPMGMLRLMDDTAAVLMRQGFTAVAAVRACDVVFDLVTDNRRGVEHFDAVVSTAGPGRDVLHDLWSAPADGHVGIATAEEREAVHAAIRGALDAEPFDWFAGKLAVVLDGVEHVLAPR